MRAAGYGRILTMASALGLASTGITVNALAPGPFRTPQNVGLNAGLADDLQVRHLLAAEIPLGRRAEPAEPAAATARTSARSR